MFGISYYKADSSTYVIQTTAGKVHRTGKGLGFFYHPAFSSVSAIPTNVQESPFIFSLQTSDFQTVKVQGQITWRVVNPEKTAEMLNFNLKKGANNYVSDDPMKLSDRVVRTVQSAVQGQVASATLREALALNRQQIGAVRQLLAGEKALLALGLEVMNLVIAAIAPSTETARALEAEAREAILQEADDAIYGRRKSAVEQERIIKEAELQTQLSVQQKEQEIEESRILNERAILRGQTETERDRLQAQIEAENQRRQYVELNSANGRQIADTEAYAIASRLKAYTELPVDNLKAMAMAHMQPEQLMAMAFETLAQNAGKIGELNITPDLFSQLLRKAGK
jgi:regulator of protease activity HflC (stomatin/prohibitin superfamily)